MFHTVTISLKSMVLEYEHVNNDNDTQISISQLLLIAFQYCALVACALLRVLASSYKGRYSGADLKGHYSRVTCSKGRVLSQNGALILYRDDMTCVSLRYLLPRCGQTS